MVGDRTPARLTVAVAAGASLAAVEYGVPHVAGSIDASFGDVAVGAVLVVIAVVLARRRRPLPGAALLLAALIWALVGMAVVVAGPFTGSLLRLALVPHALVAAVYTTLPAARANAVHERVFALAAVASGVIVGTGMVPAPLALLGAVLLLSAVRRGHDAGMPAKIGLGAAFVLVGIVGITGLVEVATQAAVVDLCLITAAIALPWLLDAESRLWRAAVTDVGDHDLLGLRLGAALQTGPIRILVPVGDGDDLIDIEGRQSAAESGATPFQDSSGRPLVFISPAVPVDPLLAPALHLLLAQLASIARKRHRQRLLAADLSASRSLLVRAGDEERRALAQRVRFGAGGRIDDIAQVLRALPGSEVLVARATETSEALLRFDEVPPWDDPPELHRAFSRISGAELRLTVELTRRPPQEAWVATWFTCCEAVSNAAKHAPGAAIDITISEGDAELIASIADAGPGGADGEGPGLRGLADRIAVLGGRFRIDSESTGTRLDLAIPVPGSGVRESLVRIPDSPDVAMGPRSIASVS